MINSPPGHNKVTTGQYFPHFLTIAPFATTGTSAVNLAKAMVAIHDPKMSYTLTRCNGTQVLSTAITDFRIDQEDSPSARNFFPMPVESQAALLGIPEMHLVHVDLSQTGNEEGETVTGALSRAPGVPHRIFQSALHQRLGHLFPRTLRPASFSGMADILNAFRWGKKGT